MFKGLKNYEIVFLIIIATIIYISIFKKKAYEHLDADSDDEDRILLEKNVKTLKEKVNKLIDPDPYRCGPDFNYKRCPGKTQCCSQWGWCGGEIGNQSDWCSDNKHGAHSGNFDGNSKYQKPTTYKISTNYKCGPQNDNTHCPGTQCCSQFGWCGGQIGKKSDWCHDNNHGTLDGHYDGHSIVDMVYPLDRTNQSYTSKSTTSSLLQGYSSKMKNDAPGNDIVYFNDASFESCRNDCNNRANCKGFNFLANSYPNNKGTCYIKSNVSNVYPNADWNLFIKN